MLGYKLDQAGFLAAFPYLLMAGIVQSAGVLADYARTKGRMTTTQGLVHQIVSPISNSESTIFLTNICYDSFSSGKTENKP